MSPEWGGGGGNYSLSPAETPDRGCRDNLALKHPSPSSDVPPYPSPATQVLATAI